MKHLIFSSLLAALLLTACHSSKSVTKSNPSPTASPSTTHIGSSDNAAAVAYAQKVASHRITAPGITASAKVRISGIGGKDLSVSGKLQMKRDAVIRLSLRMLGFELGVMEFTPTDVLVVDRYNKQYVRAAYSEVSFLRQANLDFYALQSLFWNELFLPGKHTLAASDLKRFAFQAGSEGMTVLSPTATPMLTYNFFTDPTSETVRRLQVMSKKASDKGQFSFAYDSFQPFSGRPFPTSLQLSVTGTGKDVTLGINLSSLKAASDFESATKVSDKYTRRTVKEVLGKLGMN